MPHQKRHRLLAARRWSVSVALLCIGGCSADRGEVVVLLESLPANGAEVVAFDRDPAPVQGTVQHSDSLVDADTLTLFRALSDSTARLDSTFQRQRAELNREALEMRSADRRTAEYAVRHRDFERRAAAAESLRSTRDRTRARLAALGTRHPAVVAAARQAPVRASTLAPAVRVPARADTVRLTLAPGDWWIALLPMTAPSTRVRVAAGARDTVRLR